MKSKDKLKETDIKNRTGCCFDDIVRFWDRNIEFSDILLDEKLCKKIRKYFNLWHFIQNFNRCKTIAY